MNHFYNDRVSLDMRKKEFRKFRKIAWEKPFGFITIDTLSEPDGGKYRIGLNKFFIPQINFQ